MKSLHAFKTRTAFETSDGLSTVLVSTLTLAALLLLCSVLAGWFWIWFAPAPRAAAPVQLTGTAPLQAGFGLFGASQVNQNVAVPVGISITLLGIVAATAGSQGYAVVMLEPRRILAVRAGQDIAPGVRLAEVHTDSVILERGGVKETLAWPQP